MQRLESEASRMGLLVEDLLRARWAHRPRAGQHSRLSHRQARRGELGLEGDLEAAGPGDPM